MHAEILDGNALAHSVRDELAEEVSLFRVESGIIPGLAVVLVGQHPASEVYVKHKQRACQAVGMQSSVHRLGDDASKRQLLDLVHQLNQEPSVHGILVQLPLPRQIDPDEIIESISPEKDVDGFHPLNVGLLSVGRPRFVPCTPLGIQMLLVANGIPTEGSHAVIFGRSNTVGRPMAQLLVDKHAAGGNATVTICHTGTRNPASFARQADILIVATGRAESIGADWIKPGAVVIDVGIHRRPDGTLCGDVRLDEVSSVAGWITPVPGGVGPMTVAMLLKNTFTAAKRAAARTRVS